MKKLYLIGGTMGVGKTTVCNILNKKLPNSVFLDGDWCWNAEPFVVNDETKALVMKNIVFMLNNFINCSVYENIIFCWVMHEQSIIDEITEKVKTDNCEVIKISLICREAVLRTRLAKDIDAGLRASDITNRSIERLPLYYKLDTIKINVTEKSAQDIADEIACLGSFE